MCMQISIEIIVCTYEAHSHVHTTNFKPQIETLNNHPSVIIKLIPTMVLHNGVFDTREHLPSRSFPPSV